MTGAALEYTDVTQDTPTRAVTGYNPAIWSARQIDYLAPPHGRRFSNKMPSATRNLRLARRMIIGIVLAVEFAMYLEMTR